MILNKTFIVGTAVGALLLAASAGAESLGPDERPHDGPTAAATVALIAKYVEQSPAQVRAGIAYIDPQLRVNVADVLRQIGWYTAQGMLKSDVDGSQIIDRRYVVPLQ